MKYRELRKALRFFGIQEEVSRGKGSHRIFFHDDYEGNGYRMVPVTCHNEGDNLDQSIVASVLDHFGLKQYPKKSKNIVRDSNKILP